MNTPTEDQLFRKATELGGRYDPMYSQVVFPDKANPNAIKFATWIQQRGAYNIQFNTFDVSQKYEAPGIAIVFDL